jgi:hypothetical protein
MSSLSSVSENKPIKERAWRSTCYVLDVGFCCSSYFSTLNVEAKCSSETAVNFQRISLLCIPEDRTSYNYLCENLTVYRIVQNSCRPKWSTSVKRHLLSGVKETAYLCTSQWVRFDSIRFDYACVDPVIVPAALDRQLVSSAWIETGRGHSCTNLESTSWGTPLNEETHLITVSKHSNQGYRLIEWLLLKCVASCSTSLPGPCVPRNILIALSPPPNFVMCL